MDFFATQQQAQRSTRHLVGLFGLAVVGVVLAVYFAFRLLLYKGKEDSGPFWNPELFLGVALVTLTIIAGASLYKILSLRSGAEAVANLLGARPIAPNSSEPRERRLLNVVEEMALAAGMPVPAVYVLDQEQGINAFAAGWMPGDSIIGVTRGCLETLKRDELQGVVGHELSHILNGDARLNLRLIGWLHGLIVIAMIGYWILRSGSGSSGKNDKGKGAILLFALALIVIGGIGVIFGRLIKSAVSRQREFLADASAVQFTRDPNGLAGALKKIGGLPSGSKMVAKNAEQASHLFFGDYITKHYFAGLATHPPLVDRIRRLDPSFDGTFPQIARGGAAIELDSDLGMNLPASEERLAAGVIGLGGHSIAARVGEVKPAHVAYAARLLDSLPPELRARSQDPTLAPMLLYALLLDRRPDVRVKQIEALGQAGEFVIQETATTLGHLATCSDSVRLPLLDLALPALRSLSRPQWGEFRRLTHALITADSRVSLFELALQRALVRHLGPVFGGAPERRQGTASLSSHTNEVALLLSAVAHACGETEPAQNSSSIFGANFDAAVRTLGGEAGAVRALASEACSPEAVDGALRTLGHLAPAGKKLLLEAATACVVADRVVTLGEAELLRAIADSLDCPVPPFLPGQEVG